MSNAVSHQSLQEDMKQFWKSIMWLAILTILGMIVLFHSSMYVNNNKYLYCSLVFALFNLIVIILYLLNEIRGVFRLRIAMYLKFFYICISYLMFVVSTFIIFTNPLTVPWVNIANFSTIAKIIQDIAIIFFIVTSVVIIYTNYIKAMNNCNKKKIGKNKITIEKILTIILGFILLNLGLVFIITSSIVVSGSVNLTEISFWKIYGDLLLVSLAQDTPLLNELKYIVVIKYILLICNVINGFIISLFYDKVIVGINNSFNRSEIRRIFKRSQKLKYVFIVFLIIIFIFNRLTPYWAKSL